MAVQVSASFIFTEDRFEELEFEEMCEAVEKMYRSSGYDIEQLSTHFEFVNMDSDNNIEKDDD